MTYTSMPIYASIYLYNMYLCLCVCMCSFVCVCVCVCVCVYLHRRLQQITRPSNFFRVNERRML